MRVSLLVQALAKACLSDRASARPSFAAIKEELATVAGAGLHHRPPVLAPVLAPVLKVRAHGRPVIGLWLVHQALAFRQLLNL